MTWFATTGNGTRRSDCSCLRTIWGIWSRDKFPHQKNKQEAQTTTTTKTINNINFIFTILKRPWYTAFSVRGSQSLLRFVSDFKLSGPVLIYSSYMSPISLVCRRFSWTGVNLKKLSYCLYFAFAWKTRTARDRSKLLPHQRTRRFPPFQRHRFNLSGIDWGQETGQIKQPNKKIHAIKRITLRYYHLHHVIIDYLFFYHWSVHIYHE